MSKTDKDKPYAYRSDEERKRRGKSNRSNLVKTETLGPGGKHCSCCGIHLQATRHLRAKGKREALDGLHEWQDEQESA